MMIYNVFDQIAEILAEAEPAKITAMKASGEMQERLESLTEKSKDGLLNREEKDELDHFIVLERLMRLAKIRAGTAQSAA